MSPRMNHWRAAPELMQAVRALNDRIDACGVEAGLLHLVKLRVSQINGCAFCVDMHAREARADGETEQRLHLVAAWRDSYLFTPRERAALDWAEALTRLSGHGPDDAVYEAALAQLGAADLVGLTAAIGMINMWNRFSVGFRTAHAGADRWPA